jgi:hypothetical protein
MTRRVVFYLDSGYVGAKWKETVEFEDDVTDDEIEAEFLEWLSQYGGWYDEEEAQSDASE